MKFGRLENPLVEINDPRWKIGNKKAICEKKFNRSKRFIRKNLGRKPK